MTMSVLENLLIDKITKKINYFFSIYPVHDKSDYILVPDEDFYNLSLEKQANLLIIKLRLDYKRVFIAESAYGYAGIFGASGKQFTEEILTVGVNTKNYNKIIQSAILCHEMTHYFLKKYENTLKRDDYFGFSVHGEQDTEILSYCLGLGKVMLNGFCEDYISGHKLKSKYNITGQALIFNLVNSVLDISEEEKKKCLSKTALTYIQ